MGVVGDGVPLFSVTPPPPGARHLSCTFYSRHAAQLGMEKEKKIKETLRLTGMRDSSFWVSWMVSQVCPLPVVAACQRFDA